MPTTPRRSPGSPGSLFAPGAAPLPPILPDTRPQHMRPIPPPAVYHSGSPWSVGYDSVGPTNEVTIGMVDVDVNEEGRSVASLFPIILGTWNETLPPEERLANAQLIEQAPELLRSLMGLHAAVADQMQLVPHLSRPTGVGTAMRHAYCAILGALGRSAEILADDPHGDRIDIPF